MIVEGKEFLQTLAQQGDFSAKAVLNETGIILFPIHLQHRDQKAEGISYDDNYKGNAVAAMIFPGRIEIRFHDRFSDSRVAQIIAAILSKPRLSFMRGWKVTYQGRVVQ